MSGADINLPAAFEQLVVYKECRHNHAAALGRVSLDGCQEFLKSADEGSKEAMLCIACGCHRNFHRRDTVYNPIIAATTKALQEFLNAESGAITARPSASCVQLISQRTINVNAAGGGNNPPEEEMLPSRKKRTMFTPEQRSRMIRFAERLGWRAQRAEKEEILQFCLEIGISRRMFLVWLSNKRRRAVQINTTTTTTTF